MGVEGDSRLCWECETDALGQDMGIDRVYGASIYCILLLWIIRSVVLSASLERKLSRKRKVYIDYKLFTEYSVSKR